MAKKSTTFKGQPKPMGKSGHFHESRRHSLQARGIKTGNLSKLNVPMRHNYKTDNYYYSDKGTFQIYSRDGKRFYINAGKDAELLRMPDKPFGSLREAKNYLRKRIGMNDKFGIKIDTDGDGVPDHKDCDPLDPTKQDTSVNALKKIFGGEFRTKDRIFTMIDGELYVYTDGDMGATLEKANLNEQIKSEVWGMN